MAINGAPMDTNFRKDSASEATHRRLVDVVWRRKWIVIGTFIVLTVLIGVVSRSLPKEYETSATLWVTQGSGGATFETVQAGEALAGTYGKVADNQLLAEEVATRLPFETDGETVLGAMAFEPVSETQLLRITATDGDPVRARVLANTYARTFIDYSRSELGDAVKANITFASPAAEPAQPARPQPTLYTIAGALLALVLGVGLALLAEVLDRRVRSPEELEDLVGVPVLARIPKLGRDLESRESFEEAFPLLKTNLQFFDPDHTGLRSLTVVSAMPGDGKSTVAFHLARSFAESDVQVLLVEADMRRPSLSGAAGGLGDRSGHPVGLSDYLSNKADLEQVWKPTDLGTLRFIPSGMLPPSPSSLFSVERTERLLADAQKSADLVIVDTPPLIVGAEASTIAASTDAALLVVNLEQSNKAAIRRERKQLDVVGARLLGVVANGVRKLPSLKPYGYRFSPGSGDTNGHTGQRHAKVDA
jgi:capsular exopolysaccharide synthesis family protein